MNLQTCRDTFTQELKNILDYWIKNTSDSINGGFIGRIDENNQIHSTAPKGAVLNARILWSFSAAYNLLSDKVYLEYAFRAYQYFTEHFIDKEHKGVFWSVDYKGKPLDTKKQVYAIAFTIYGLSEFYRASGLVAAKELAAELFRTLEKYSYDKERGGYFEAFSREWGQIDDLRLSAKDANEKKTMNTHLHVLEAYTNLYRIWPVNEVEVQIRRLIHSFLNYIIDAKTDRLILFFDEYWRPKSDVISYGHDIEASWLLVEAAEAICDYDLISKLRGTAVKMARNALDGLDADGGMWYESEGSHIIKEKHWWVQAEAIVGFFNAWQISNDEIFLNKFFKNWSFVQEKICDTKNGEWFWGIREDGSTMPGQDKIGIWKCPYHNSRACIEIIKRISVNH